MTDNETSEENGPLNILVTDGVSALGLATVAALVDAGHTVNAVATNTTDAVPVRERGALPVFLDNQRAGELRSAIDMAKATIVVDTAVQAANIPPFRLPDYTPEMVLNGTRALVEAAQSADTDVQLIVYPSFAFLYGDTGGEPVDETHALTRDRDAWVAAAREAEQLVRDANVPACVLRAGYLYGPSAAMESVAAALRGGKPVPTGDREDNYVGWIHSSDLAQALALAVVANKGGEVYNIVDDTPTPPATFLGHFTEALGISEDQLFGAIMKMFSFGVKTNKTLLGYSAKPTNDKAKNELGWTPRHADYTTGIEELLLAWRAAMHP